MKISELATVIPGFSPKPGERKNRGKYLLISGRNIQASGLILTKKDSFADEIDRESFRRARAIEGDIIVSTLFDTRKLHIYDLRDRPGVVTSSCAIIRSPDRTDYILSYLRTLGGQQEFLQKAARATSKTFIPRLSVVDLAKIDVPILPLEGLQRLGDAHIAGSTTDELLVLKEELKAKDAEIVRLKEENKVTEQYYENRVSRAT